ncbi:hypothetical protein LXA43DRAFT_904323, partial [Ganoderma leucocontextum]
MAHSIPLPGMAASVPSLSNRLYYVSFLKNDSSNYTTCKFRVQRILMQCQIWNIVNSTEAQP